jgi:hypothetical protein
MVTRRTFSATALGAFILPSVGLAEGEGGTIVVNLENQSEEGRLKLKSGAHLPPFSFLAKAGKRLDDGNLELSLDFLNNDILKNGRNSEDSTRNTKVAFPSVRHYLTLDERTRMADFLSPIVESGDLGVLKTYTDAVLETAGLKGPGSIAEKIIKFIKEHKMITPLDAIVFGLDFAFDIYKRLDQRSIAEPVARSVHENSYLFCSLEIDLAHSATEAKPEAGVCIREALCYAGRDSNGTYQYSILWTAEYLKQGWGIA